MKTAKEIIELIGEIRGRLTASKHISADARYRYWKCLEDLIDGRARIANQVLRNAESQRNIGHLRQLYAEFLFDLEMEWSRKFLLSKSASLSEYPKYRHYELRVSYEMHMLSVICARPIRKILLVGCGSLPLSALMIKHDFGATVDLLDRNIEALRHAKRLIQKYDREMKSAFIHADALRFKGFGNYDVVFLAGTVGADSPTRQKIVEKVFSGMKKASVLVLRPPINLEKIILADLDPESVKDAEIFWSEIDCKEDTIRRAFLVRK